MALDLVWSLPPRRGQLDDHPWDDIERELHAKPMSWCRVLTFGKASAASGIVAAIRKGRTQLEPLHYEATSRKIDDSGAAGVWLRYVGPISDDQ
jgi:hypothetical protein